MHDDPLYRLTGGAWDATVSPLVELWGFGTKKAPSLYPSRDEIEAALSKTGFSGIFLKGGVLTKKRGSLSLDLGSIAKGYGVDTLADLLREKGVEDFLVEVGGEVYAQGHRMDGMPWRVCISSPERGAVSGDFFQEICELFKIFPGK